jgi:uncharacterized membrane protein YfcA
MRRWFGAVGIRGRGGVVSGDFVAAIVLVLCGGAVSGLAGFGFALVTVPPLLLIYDPPTVVALSISLTLLSGWVVLLDSWREVRRSTVVALLPGALVGVGIGVTLVQVLDPAYIKLLAGIVVVAFTLAVARGWTPAGAGRPAAPGLAGVASGVLNATTGMAGPPVVLLFAARGFGVQPFRATTVAYFYFVDAAGLAVLIQQGVIGRSELRVAGALLPAALVGTFVGRSLVRRVSPEGFRRITFGLLVLTGAVGVVDALVALV